MNIEIHDTATRFDEMNEFFNKGEDPPSVIAYYPRTEESVAPEKYDDWNPRAKAHYEMFLDDAQLETGYRVFGMVDGIMGDDIKMTNMVEGLKGLLPKNILFEYEQIITFITRSNLIPLRVKQKIIKRTIKSMLESIKRSLIHFELPF